MSSIARLFSELGLADPSQSGGDIAVHSPVDGAKLATLRSEDSASIEAKIAAADKAFKIGRASCRERVSSPV